MDSVQPRDQPTREWGEQAYMRTRKWIQVVVISNLVIVIWCMWIAVVGELVTLKSAQKISHTPLHHHHQPEPLRQGRMDPCFHVLYAKFWPYQSECCSRNRDSLDQATFFPIFYLSNFGEPVWIVASVFCFLADRSSTRFGLLLL